MSQQSNLDLEFVRTQFPGLRAEWAFFDNAGGTQILAGVVERMNEFLFRRNVQTGGSYAVSKLAAQSLLDGRRAMQQLVNASRAEEIVFAPSATVALQNLARSMHSQLAPGDEIIVTVSDHESNIGPWVGLEKLGVKVKTWKINRETLTLELEELAALMTPATKLVAVTQVSNILGTVNPIADIARVVHERGALICVDAVACAPHCAIDVQALDVDFLVFALYKIFGPHYAVMYGKHAELLKLDNLYHYFYAADKVPAKLEPGNASYELAYGSIGIVDYLCDLGRRAGGTDAAGSRGLIEAAYAAITAHENRIGERLLAWLRQRSDCRIIGIDRGDVDIRVPTISFKVDGRESGEIARQVDAHFAAIRFGDFHARRLVEYLGLEQQGGVLRVSMAHYNTPEEVDRLIAALEATL